MPVLQGNTKDSFSPRMRVCEWHAPHSLQLFRGSAAQTPPLLKAARLGVIKQQTKV